MLACVQTCPLFQKKSGEETSPDFSLFSRFYLREGGRLYTGYDLASLYLYYVFNFVALFSPLSFQKNKQTNKNKKKTKRLISTRSQAVSYITQFFFFTFNVIFFQLNTEGNRFCLIRKFYLVCLFTTETITATMQFS